MGSVVNVILLTNSRMSADIETIVGRDDGTGLGANVGGTDGVIEGCGEVGDGAVGPRAQCPAPQTPLTVAVATKSSPATAHNDRRFTKINALLRANACAE